MADQDITSNATITTNLCTFASGKTADNLYDGDLLNNVLTSASTSATKGFVLFTFPSPVLITKIVITGRNTAYAGIDNIPGNTTDIASGSSSSSIVTNTISGLNVTSNTVKVNSKNYVSQMTLIEFKIYTSLVGTIPQNQAMSGGT